MTVRTLEYMNSLEQNLKLHWFIKLGLWEQAAIYCGEDDLTIDVLDFPCIRVGFIANHLFYPPHALQMFYIQVY